MAKKKYNTIWSQTHEAEESTPLEYEDNSYISKEPAPEPDGERIRPVIKREEPKPKKQLQSIRDVNFRLSKDVKRTDNIIGVLKGGLNVDLLEDQGDWMYVEFERKKGYIMSKYLKEV